jgi:uncharacterized protein (UPF0332 family)
VIQPGGTFLDKARESVAGARAEYDAGRYNNAVNRSYYAVFQAAIHALQLDGIRLPGGGDAWGHAFVDSQFSGLLINRRHLYDTSLRNVVEENRRLREDADYTPDSINPIRASRSVQRAERFVTAVTQREAERS